MKDVQINLFEIQIFGTGTGAILRLVFSMFTTPDSCRRIDRIGVNPAASTHCVLDCIARVSRFATMLDSCGCLTSGRMRPLNGRMMTNKYTAR